MLQGLQSMSSLFYIGAVLIAFWAFLLIVVESNASPRKKEKLTTRLLQEHYLGLEIALQASFTVGLIIICLPPALTLEDIIISIDLIILPFYISPIFIIGIHRRLRHFRDIIEERIMGLPEETFESLEPVLYARVTLIYWAGSLIALVCYYAFRTSGVYPVIASVLLHYGIFGLFFFTSPLLFSLGSLRKKSTKAESTSTTPMIFES